MAELAAGAVSSLLVVIRNEALLLRGVHGDVQFIKEEMESMNSFLAHLARSAPPSGEHDEQVRTWMNQVRLLAQDCNNCIDLYLYRGNPDIQRARDRIRRHLWWVYWFLHKMVAQHRAAVQLGQLKERARDVGERRLRYGVEVPAKSSAPGQSLHEASAASSSSAQAAAPSAAGGYAVEDDEEDGDDQLLVAATTDHSGQRALFSRTLEDYVKMKLLEWQKEIPLRAKVTLSIGIMAPNAYMDILTIAEETLVFQPGWEAHRTGYNLIVTVDIPAVHPDFLQLRSKEVLFYILHELKLKHSKSQSHEQDTDEEEVQEEENKEEEEEKEKVEEEEEKEEEEEQGDDDDDDLDSWQVYSKKVSIYGEKKRVLNKIKKNIRVEIMKINKKIDKIKSDIQTRPTKGHQKKGTDQQGQDIHILLKQLLRSSQPYQLRDKDMPKLLATDNAILTVATKLKEYMEADEGEEEGEEKDGANKVVEEREGEGGGGGGEMVEEEEEREGGGDIGEVEVVDEDDDEDEEEEMRQMVPIHLDEVQYVHILRKLFPKTTSSSNKPATKQTTSTVLGEDQIKQMIHESKHEIIQLLQNGKHDKNQETSELDTQGQNTEDVFTEIIKQKMEKIKQEFKEQLKIKGLVEDIKHELKDESRHSGYKCPLFVLKVDETVDLPLWEDTRKALSLLGCSADVLVVTDTKDIQQAREYCYPKREPIDYSLAGLYYDTVLQITSQQKNEGSIDSQIFRNILKECEPHEFCMKLFTHTLYTNPKRSNEELNKLHKNLQASPKSLDVIAKKIFKFSYSDMPKEYKSCLMYLAIFPPGHKIRRSTLIGRWVAEGLIFREDWPRSVRWANRCFDELMDRWLAYPADIGATGKVKSCVVGDRVHGFITKIARKQHIVETRLSRHLAYHFSIFNDVQLRSSDGIENFFQRLSKSSRVSLLKVLDLEGCQCFGGKNQRYLKDICSKMLLLKYLSLRRTDITQLPSEINNLRELEVLDIRQTQVPEYETRHILLLKMKRLLAGHIDMNLSNSDTSTGIEAKKLVSAVQIPHKIEKMEHMEVLSNVKAKRCRDLRDIGKLWQLRKLGVVIDDNKPSHLKNLLQAISDLHECLCSLSITLPVHYSEESLPVSLTHTPKLLESLSISGNTQKGHLLPLFAGDVNNKLAKVTLSNTTLNQHNLKVLAQLPKLQFVRLRHIAISEDILTIEEDEFENLNYLLVEGSSWTKIIFDGQEVRELKKMVLSFTSIESVSGVDHLQKLEEVELSISGCSSSNNGQLLSSFKNAEQLAKLTIRGTSLEQGGPQIRNQITFNKDEFPKLKHLIVEGSNLTKIIFEPQAARELKKMVLAFTNIESVSGIVHLQKLEEVELSISGSNSNNGGLLSSFNNAKQLAKLAVRGTTLKQVGPQIQNQFTLNKDEFPKLKLLILDCSAITEIVFSRGSAPKLEKIVWSSFTSLYGIDKLPRLKELEFNGVLVPQEVKEAIRKRKNKPSLKSSEPKIQDQPKRNEQEDDDDAAGFSFCWKKQV